MSGCTTTSPVQTTGGIPRALLPITYPENRPREVEAVNKWAQETKPNPLELTSAARAGTEFVGLLGLVSYFGNAGPISEILTLGGLAGTVITWLKEPKFDLPAKTKPPQKGPSPKGETTTTVTGETPSPETLPDALPETGSTGSLPGAITITNSIVNIIIGSGLPSLSVIPRDTPLQPPKAKQPSEPHAPPDEPPSLPEPTRIPGTGSVTEPMSLEDLIAFVKKKTNSLNKRKDAIDEIMKRYPGLNIDQREQVVNAFIFTIGDGKAKNDKSDKVKVHIVDQMKTIINEPTERIVNLLIKSLEAENIEPDFKTKIAYRIADIDKRKLTLSPMTINELKRKFDSLRERIEGKIIHDPRDAEAGELIQTLTAALLGTDKIDDQDLPKYISLLSIALNVLLYSETKKEIISK